MSDPGDFLVVEGLGKEYRLKQGGVLRAVYDVSLRQRRGETLGVVGESGCGKSTLARMVLHLTPPSSGRVSVDGDVLGELSPSALRRKRRLMQMIFQDPNASLDPRMRVGSLIEEPLVIHRMGGRADRARRVAELLDLVGLPAEAARRYPHEFSGGQRQRISIARALAVEPALVVADEPVSALDVSIQAQILNLLAEIRARFGLTFMFISHDLAVVRHISDRIAVMYLGQVVERAVAEDFFARPLHPYSQMLLAAVLEPGEAPKTDTISGEPPDPQTPPPGCTFHPRCPFAMERCRHEAPPEIVVARSTVRCWLYV